NPYGMLRFEGDPLPCLRELDPENVIYLGTLSKVFSPGVRIGWVSAEPGVAQRLIQIKEAADLCTSSFMQLVSERYLAGDRWLTCRGPLSTPTDAGATGCGSRSAIRRRATSRRECAGSERSSPTRKLCTAPSTREPRRGPRGRPLPRARGLAPLRSPRLLRLG